MKRRSVGLRIILDSKDGLPRNIDSMLLKAVARGKRRFEEIASSRVHSSAELARREALQKGYVVAL